MTQRRAERVVGSRLATAALLVCGTAFVHAQQPRREAQQPPAFRPSQASSFRDAQQPSFRNVQPASRSPQARLRPQSFAGGAVLAGMQQNTAPAPVERRQPQVSAAPPLPSANPQPGRTPGAAFAGAHGEHLAEWMNLHSRLSPQQQQDALGHEPGFRELPQQTQERMRERLSQLDAMSPQQRQRMLAHTEEMERLQPTQRAEVRSAMLQLGSLPPEQRRTVARAFRELRALPPEERQGAMERYGSLSPQQRATLDHLLQVEPMLPQD